ncbi:MAG: 3-phosphoshikimate 1-carboxyvinyltransferase [Paraprevotella sp.]|nr:3-phosphoshikimate 1-carboxyvinyltransferase [Paraprevotella sp.]
MRYKLTPPARLRCRIMLPASKSISNRALIIHAMSKGGCELNNVSECDDTFVMQRALNSTDEQIDIMAAGTAMRFLTAYLAVTPGKQVITGTERMKHRPIAVLVDALRALGAHIEYVEKEGFPPLRISGGTYQGGELSLPGHISSQYISALLMIAPMLKNGLTLSLEGNIVSRPYIDLTLQIMRDFGAEAAWRGDHQILVQPVPYESVPYKVENDWSAASYWYQMVALSEDSEAEVLLPGLCRNSYQGDSEVQRMFRILGVSTDFITDEEGCECVRLRKIPVTASLAEIDFVNQPDLAQTFVVTCAMLNIPFRFTGLQSLKIKETDRMVALQCELRKLGYVIESEQDSILYWNGERCRPEEYPCVDTYEDHRMAMAFAPCCQRLTSIVINNPEVVSKSYPRYWDNLQTAGFNLTES